MSPETTPRSHGETPGRVASSGKLTGPKKAAILLLALGEEGAAEIVKNLEDSEIQQVGYYMARFTDVSPEELDVVLEEFY